MTEHAARIQSAALECVGTPYHHKGRRVGVGLDCGGLVDHCRVAVGWAPARVPSYSFPPSTKVLLAEFEKHLERVDAPPRPGSVVALWTGRPGRVRHTGVAVELEGALWLVQADSMVVSVTRERLWGAHLDRLHSCWSIPLCPGGLPNS